MSDFETVKTLIRIAKSSGNMNDQYIKTIVHDAKIVRYSPSNIRSITRETYRFSVTLGRGNSDFLRDMNPEDLKEPDLIKLLRFFESI